MSRYTVMIKEGEEYKRDYTVLCGDRPVVVLHSRKDAFAVANAMEAEYDIAYDAGDDYGYDRGWDVGYATGVP